MLYVQQPYSTRIMYCRLSSDARLAAAEQSSAVQRGEHEHLDARHESAELVADERAARVRRVHVHPQPVPRAHWAQRSQVVERAARRRAPRAEPL